MSSAFVARSWAIARCAVIAAAGLLGACNLAVSTHPLFRAADGGGAPPLKPGIWSLKKACDEAGLACRGFNALRVLIGPSDIRFDPAAPAPSQPPPFKTPVAYVLAGGAPRVLQVRFEPTDKSGPRVAYAFFGLAATSRDPAGEITSADIWTVDCGPPPKPGDPGYEARDDERFATLHRLPGMVDSPVGDCAPSDAAVARHAADLSQTWEASSPSAFSIRWVAPPPSR